VFEFLDCDLKKHMENSKHDIPLEVVKVCIFFAMWFQSKLSGARGHCNAYLIGLQNHLFFCLFNAPGFAICRVTYFNYCRESIIATKEELFIGI
jgi:hypothetical protein